MVAHQAHERIKSLYSIIEKRRRTQGSIYYMRSILEFVTRLSRKIYLN